MPFIKKSSLLLGALLASLSGMVFAKKPAADAADSTSTSASSSVVDSADPTDASAATVLTDEEMEEIYGGAAARGTAGGPAPLKQFSNAPKPR